MTTSVQGVSIPSLPAATTPLDGTELVVVQQAGITKQVASAEVGSAGSIPEATVRGRAVGAGSGPVVTLTDIQLGDIVWNSDFQNSSWPTRRLDNDIGYIRFPPQEIDGVTFDLILEEIGLYYYQNQASTSTITVPAEATLDLGDGYVVSFGGVHAGSVIDIVAEPGVTITSLVDGATGDIQLAGFGIVTLWKIGTNAWHCHGSGFTMV